MIKKIAIVVLIGICVYFRGWIVQEGQAMFHSASYKANETSESFRMTNTESESKKLEELEK